jgi:hypothetical protein
MNDPAAVSMTQAAQDVTEDSCRLQRHSADESMRDTGSSGGTVRFIFGDGVQPAGAPSSMSLS